MINDVKDKVREFYDQDIQSGQVPRGLRDVPAGVRDGHLDTKDAGCNHHEVEERRQEVTPPEDELGRGLPRLGLQGDQQVYQDIRRLSPSARRR